MLKKKSSTKKVAKPKKKTGKLTLTPESKTRMEKKSSKKKTLDKKNSTATTKKVVSERSVKWKYPKDMTDAGEKKKFRAKYRTDIRKMERDLKALEGKKATAKNGKVKLTKELAATRKEVLLDAKAEV